MRPRVSGLLFARGSQLLGQAITLFAQLEQLGRFGRGSAASQLGSHCSSCSAIDCASDSRKRASSACCSSSWVAWAACRALNSRAPRGAVGLCLSPARSRTDSLRSIASCRSSSCRSRAAVNWALQHRSVARWRRQARRARPLVAALRLGQSPLRAPAAPARSRPRRVVLLDFRSARSRASSRATELGAAARPARRGVASAGIVGARRPTAAACSPPAVDSSPAISSATCCNRSVSSPSRRSSRVFCVERISRTRRAPLDSCRTSTGGRQLDARRCWRGLSRPWWPFRCGCAQCVGGPRDTPFDGAGPQRAPVPARSRNMRGKHGTFPSKRTKPGRPSAAPCGQPRRCHPAGRTSSNCSK